MIKLKLIMLFIFSVSVGNLYTQETDFNFALNIANIGGDVAVLSDLKEGNFTFNLLNLYIEHKKTNIGIELSSFNYWSDKPDFLMSFLNIKLYYNLLGLWRNNYFVTEFNGGSTYAIVGPSVSLNYLGLGSNYSFDLNKIQVNIGLKALVMFDFSVFWKGSVPVGLQIGSVELGYRFNNWGVNNHQFYLSFTTDVLVLIYIIKTLAEISK